MNAVGREPDRTVRPFRMDCLVSLLRIGFVQVLDDRHAVRVLNDDVVVLV